MNPLDHLRAADPILRAVIEQIGPLEATSSRGDDHFLALARTIVGQQLSTKAAHTIWTRVLVHFETEFSPSAVLKTEVATLRTLGLSGQKAGYLHNLAQHVHDEKLDVAHLETLDDTEVTNQIVAVKGLGPWSADMFLMFHLNRNDILPVGDLGIREAMKQLYELETRPIPTEMERIAKPWQPYRTLACRYLWKYLDSP